MAMATPHWVGDFGRHCHYSCIRGCFPLTHVDIDHDVYRACPELEFYWRLRWLRCIRQCGLFWHWIVLRWTTGACRSAFVGGTNCRGNRCRSVRIADRLASATPQGTLLCYCYARNG